MKTITKVSIELTNEEYDAIINAQEILTDIASKLDAEGALNDELNHWFDKIDCVTDIIEMIQEGIEIKDGE